MSLARLVELFEPYHMTVTDDEAQELAVKNHHTKHQITVEVVLTATGAVHVPAAGTLQVSYKPKGAAAYQNLTGTYDLTAAPITETLDGVYDSLQFTPANLDADCSFSVKYSGYMGS